MMFAKNKLFLIGGVIIVILGGIMIKKAVMPKNTSSVSLPQAPKAVESINGVGTLEAKEVVILAPKTTAKLQELYADEGDEIGRAHV